MSLLDRVFHRKKGKTRKVTPISADTGFASAADENTRGAGDDISTRHVGENFKSPSSAGVGTSNPLGTETARKGFFPNASNFVVNQPVMADNPTVIHKLVDKSMTIHNIDNGQPVLEALSRDMTQGADVDSSARHPPPKCYPGTRKSLTAKIEKWLFDNNRTWDLLWLYGPAGVGKSAVAQTVAEFAKDHRRLGAAFFFSKTNKRKDLQPVFITLAYQLAVRFPGYLPLVAKELGADPDLLKKAPHVQFRQLIIEPLSSMPAHPKYLIVLDGLDECDGETAQLHIVELINNVILSQVSLPIIWMICSRPEHHLMRTLSRPDFSIQCWREVLAIDTEESRDDTARFIRTRFKEVHDLYGDCVEEDANGVWPPEEDVTRIVDEASGLFVFASTIMRYIEDAGSGNPNARLSEVLSVIRHSLTVGPRSPMETLDQLYTRILSDVPEDIWPVTHRLLKVLVSPPEFLDEISSPRFLCNFLGITRGGFYTAMRKLHSVLGVPSPDEAYTSPLRFLHASFRDYLVQPMRSGRFCASLPPDFKGNDEVQKACLQFLCSPVLFLAESAYKLTDMLRPLIPTLDESVADQQLNLHLAWFPPDHAQRRKLTEHLIRVAQRNAFLSYGAFRTPGDQHHELEAMLRSFDYNSLTFSVYAQAGVARGIPGFVHWVKSTSLHDLVRTHSMSEIDDKLLSYLKGTNAKIEFLNLNDDSHLSSATEEKRVCFLLGYGSNAVLVLASRAENSSPKYCSAKSAVEIWPSIAGLPGSPVLMEYIQGHSLLPKVDDTVYLL